MLFFSALTENTGFCSQNQEGIRVQNEEVRTPWTKVDGTGVIQWEINRIIELKHESKRDWLILILGGLYVNKCIKIFLNSPSDGVLSCLLIF